MRKLLIITAILVVLIVGAIGAVLAFVDVNQYRATIQTKLQERLHRNVTLGTMSLKFIPLSIRIEDVAIGDAPEFGSQAPFLAAKEMFVSLRLPALLAKRVEINSLRIVQPQVQLIKNRLGKWNFETLSSGSGPTGSGGSQVTLGELLIENGTVAVTDQAAGKSASTYDHIDVTLKDFAPGQHFDLVSRIHLPGNGKEQIVLKATGASASDLSGSVSLETVSLAGLRTFLGTGSSELVDVVLSGDAKFQRQANIMNGQGSIAIIDSKIKDPGQLDFAVRDDGQNGVLDVPSFTAKLGTVTVTGRAQTKLNPSTVDAQIRTDNASIAEFIRLAKIAGVTEGVDGTGRLSLDVRLQGSTANPTYSGSGSIRSASFTTPSLRKPLDVQTADLQFAEDQVKLQNLVAGIGKTHLHGSASVKNFKDPVIGFNAGVDAIDVAEAETWTVPAGEKSGKNGSPSKPVNGSGTVTVGKIVYNDLVLTDVKADCKLAGGIIQLNPLTARLFGGTETGDVTIDMRQAQPKYAIQSKLAGIDANQLISSTSAMKNVVYGTISETTDIHVSLIAGQNMARGLNGTVQMVLVNGKLTGISVMNEVAKVGKFLGYSIVKDNVTNISKMSGTFKIQDGVANTDDLQMAFDGGSLSGAGVIGLVDQTLNLKLTTVLARDKSQQAGGTGIGGLMSTALANSKGELVIPATVKGTFTHPQFEPDTAQIARMKLAGLLPTRDNPAEAVSKVAGIIGAFTGKQPADQKDQKQNDPTQSILGVIDALRKKK